MASVCVALALAEIGVRWVAPQPLAAVGRSARLGWTHKPNAQFVYERDEYRVPIQYSSAGLRDREYTRAKPADTFRIAILGDSFVEALQVPEDSMLSRLLEHELARRDGTRRYEVMNFGVSGYGSCQQLVLLEERVLDYAPDLVVAVHYHNDFDDNARFDLCRTDESHGLTITEPARFGWTTRAVSGLKSTLWQRSHLFNFVSTRRLRRSMQRRGTPDVSAPPADAAQSLELQMTRIAETPEARAALGLHAAIVARMQSLCQAAGARFVAVLGVSAGQIDSRRLPKELRADASDVTLLNRRAADALAARGIAVVDLLPAFRDARGAYRLFFDVDGHWTADGHAVAAHSLAETLSAAIVRGSHSAP